MTSPLSLQMFIPTEQVEDPCPTCGADQRRGEPRFLHFFSRTEKALCAVRCARCVEPVMQDLRHLALLTDDPKRHSLKRDLAAHYEATQGGTRNEAGELHIDTFGPIESAYRAQCAPPHDALNGYEAEREAADASFVAPTDTEIAALAVEMAAPRRRPATTIPEDSMDAPPVVEMTLEGAPGAFAQPVQPPAPPPVPTLIDPKLTFAQPTQTPNG